MSTAVPFPEATQIDRDLMVQLAQFTKRTLDTSTPVPFGAMITRTGSAEMLVCTVNNVAGENDPTCHGEIRAIRLASQKLGSYLLQGYTLYTTCEPCPMCMGGVLWARLDRIVYGATIEDAAAHCNQIYIGAREVVAKSDMPCAIIGPVERELCYSLFTHPNMLEKFQAWKKGNR